MEPSCPEPRRGADRRCAAPSRGRGFTLLEVLVALTIVAVALAAAMRGAIALTGNSRSLDERLYATMVAQNQLLELRLTQGQVPLSDADFDCEEGGVALHCVQKVTPTPNPFFRWVEVQVLDVGPAPRVLADVMTLVRTN